MVFHTAQASQHNYTKQSDNNYTEQSGNNKKTFLKAQFVHLAKPQHSPGESLHMVKMLPISALQCLQKWEIRS